MREAKAHNIIKVEYLVGSAGWVRGLQYAAQFSEEKILAVP